VYAKSWCGFFDPSFISDAYFDWREQLKAYMTACTLDPGQLTATQVKQSLSSLAPFRP